MPLDNAPDDTFTLEGMIGWLETQPSSTQYSYIDTSGGCLVGRYFKARGLKVDVVRPSSWHSSRKWYKWTAEHHKLPRLLNKVAVGRPFTYGAALVRARELLDA